MSSEKRMSREERSLQIITVGEKIFLEKGFNLTAKDIAEKIGISETMIYTIFPNKKKIIDAIYDHHFRDKAGRIKTGEFGPDYKERLTIYMFYFLKAIYTENTMEMLLLYSLEKSKNKPDFAILGKIIPGMIKPMENYLASGVEKGYLREIDPVSATDFIHNSVFNFVFLHLFFYKERYSDEELKKIIGGFVDLILNGILKK